MAVTKIEKIIKFSKSEIIRYQLMHHCFVKNIKISETELKCLALLGEVGQIRLSEFGKIAAAKGILGSSIAVTSCLSKIERSGLFLKKNNGKKIIFLNPELKIQSEGNIIIDLKLIKVEQANTAEPNLQKNSAATSVA